MTVLFTAGVLLATDSRSAAIADPFLDGDRAVVCADEWTSAKDPEIPLPRKNDHTTDIGYHAPVALPVIPVTPSDPPRTHFARAPPAA